jgi:hypothetical protein
MNLGTVTNLQNPRHFKVFNGSQKAIFDAVNNRVRIERETRVFHEKDTEVLIYDFEKINGYLFSMFEDDKKKPIIIEIIRKHLSPNPYAIGEIGTLLNYLEQIPPYKNFFFDTYITNEKYFNMYITPCLKKIYNWNFDINYEKSVIKRGCYFQNPHAEELGYRYKLFIKELQDIIYKEEQENMKDCKNNSVIVPFSTENEPNPTYTFTDKWFEDNLKQIEDRKKIYEAFDKTFNTCEKNDVKKKKKKPISATIKRLVWNTNIGEDIGKSKCMCCKSTDITQMSFNCGHILAEANGGDTIVSNLKPICQNCNSSMGTKNMEDFMKSLK